METARSHCDSGFVPNGHRSGWTFAIPWVIPAIAIATAPRMAPWVAMWSIALCLFAAFKWLTWRNRCSFNTSGWRTSGYFLAWPGLDADRFFGARRVARGQSRRFLLLALARTTFGGLLIWVVTPQIPDDCPCLKGTIGFTGLVCLLHFGCFDLLSVFWNWVGVDAPQIMDRPFAAASLADFWGRRWNTAYRRVSYDLFFRPLTTRLGMEAALLTSFLASGLFHELVISIPAGSGYGGPTAYFLIQGIGLLWERTPPMRNAFKRKPVTGRLFTATFILAPVALLFHPPFLTRVVAPFLSAIGA